MGTRRGLHTARASRGPCSVSADGGPKRWSTAGVVAFAAPRAGPADDTRTRRRVARTGDPLVWAERRRCVSRLHAPPAAGPEGAAQGDGGGGGGRRDLR